MLSPQHITKATAAALAVGAFATPVASAGPLAGYSRQDKQLTSGALVSTGGQDLPPILPAPNPSQRAAIQRAEQQAAHGFADTLANNARYSNAATNAYPSHSGGVRVIAQAGGFDWGDAGIGAAGGLLLSAVGIGGGLVLVQRRARRTGTTAMATG